MERMTCERDKLLPFDMLEPAFIVSFDSWEYVDGFIKSTEKKSKIFKVFNNNCQIVFIYHSENINEN